MLLELDIPTPEIEMLEQLDKRDKRGKISPIKFTSQDATRDVMASLEAKGLVDTHVLYIEKDYSTFQVYISKSGVWLLNNSTIKEQ